MDGHQLRRRPTFILLIGSSVFIRIYGTSYDCTYTLINAFKWPKSNNVG